MKRRQETHWGGRSSRSSGMAEKGEKGEPAMNRRKGSKSNSDVRVFVKTGAQWLLCGGFDSDLMLWLVCVETYNTKNTILDFVGIVGYTLISSCPCHSQGTVRPSDWVSDWGREREREEEGAERKWKTFRLKNNSTLSFLSVNTPRVRGGALSFLFFLFFFLTKIVFWFLLISQNLKL